MKDDDFCQMLLYSLINLICFLLTVIFLTALYNVRSQLKLLHLDVWSEYYTDLEMYQNSYTATATLFAFNFLGFVGFMGVLLLLINKMKVNKSDYESNNMREVNIHQQNGDVRTDERMGNTGTIENTALNRYKPEEDHQKLLKVMLIFFLFSQFVFLIEVIVITVYHSKSSDLESDQGLGYSQSELNYFTKIYRDLIIVGYIFLVIFIVFDLYTIILVTKCGKRLKFEQDDMENLDKHKYCDCFSVCLTNCCEKMATIFNKCEREDENNEEVLKERLKKLEEKYKELNDYSEKLKTLNENISKNKTMDSINTELENLNLPKSEVAMITQRIEISTKV